MYFQYMEFWRDDGMSFLYFLIGFKRSKVSSVEFDQSRFSQDIQMIVSKALSWVKPWY